MDERVFDRMVPFNRKVICMKQPRATSPWLLGALALLAALNLSAQEAGLRKISVEEYRDKVYGSWLAQCIGNIYGLPHENAYIDEPGPETFPYGYGKNLERLKRVNGAFSDDDTDIEYMYLLAMEKHGPEPTLAELAAMWKYHVRDRVWLANRAAVAAMIHGYTPPVTGQKEFNPHWFQIDPQLINEIWSVTAPGMAPYRRSAAPEVRRDLQARAQPRSGELPGEHRDRDRVF